MMGHDPVKKESVKLVALALLARSMSVTGS